MSWWQDAGATVESCDCDHYLDECPTNRTYGPRIVRRRDSTGHQPEVSLLVVGETTYQVFDCECGKRDLWVNYREHLADVAPTVVVYQ